LIPSAHQPRVRSGRAHPTGTSRGRRAWQCWRPTSPTNDNWRQHERAA